MGSITFPISAMSGHPNPHNRHGLDLGATLTYFINSEQELLGFHER